jgi:hypothetical protein
MEMEIVLKKTWLAECGIILLRQKTTGRAFAFEVISRMA